MGAQGTIPPPGLHSRMTWLRSAGTGCCAKRVHVSDPIFLQGLARGLTCTYGLWAQMEPASQGCTPSHP